MAQLEALGPADIPEVMRIERIPDYAEFVGQFTHDEHLAEMTEPTSRYFGFRDGARLVGFVIFQQLDARSVLLRRIAVAEVGRGIGTDLLRTAVGWAFRETPARAVTLDVYRGNPRARHVYERQGFTFTHEDETHVFLELPRERWEASRE